jgi:murein DD-endopeptidase MepM/ murein hydrolase activator NlpD
LETKLSEWILPFPDSDITCAHGIVDELHPRGHRGTDYGKGTARKGAPIKAVTRGKVVRSEWHENLGNVVVTSMIGGKYAYFCHLIEPGLPVGTIVDAGDVIGKIGNTGRYSFGAHLHCGISEKVEGVYAGKVESLPAFVKARQAEVKKAAPAAKPVVKPAAVKPAVKPVVAKPVKAEETE